MSVRSFVWGRAQYVVWRDSVVATPSQRGALGGRGKKLIAERKSALPPPTQLLRRGPPPAVAQWLSGIRARLRGICDVVPTGFGRTMSR
jgi:hypothetical protein